MTTNKNDAEDSPKKKKTRSKSQASKPGIDPPADADRSLQIESAELVREPSRERDDRHRGRNFYDETTRLGNRHFFVSRLDRVIASAERAKTQVAMLEIVPRRWEGNGRAPGAAESERSLRDFGAQLRGSLRRTDQAFRIGDDHFAVLLEPGTEIPEGAGLAARAVAARLAPAASDYRSTGAVGLTTRVLLFPGSSPESMRKLPDESVARSGFGRQDRQDDIESDGEASSAAAPAGLLQLVYASTAVGPLSKGDLLALLLRERLRNERLSLTGMLLYKLGRFMEALEGDAETIRNLLSVIEQDGRHKNLDILRLDRVDRRGFPDWSMGFEDLDLSSIRGYTGFLRTGQDPDFFDESAVEAHAMLASFQRAQFRKPFDP